MKLYYDNLLPLQYIRMLYSTQDISIVSTYTEMCVLGPSNRVLSIVQAF